MRCVGITHGEEELKFVRAELDWENALPVEVRERLDRKGVERGEFWYRLSRFSNWTLELP